MKRHVSVLHGPNLNLLGTREPDIYGTTTLADIDAALTARATARGFTIDTYQSNHEGAIVDRLHELASRAGAIVINPGAYTHTSVAIADALRAIAVPAIEVHLSHLARREPFRRKSLVGPACVGVVSGFGWRSYIYALDAALDLVETAPR